MAARIHGALYPAPSEGLPLIIAIFKDGQLAGCNIAPSEAEGEAMIKTAVAELQRLEVMSNLPANTISVRRPVQPR
ncbi:hypothetical protein [Phenylobacterium sp.]|uniref:hypothetical protein n=1 Tax=Phenylobacterium sp. TaxID=1871053 RepID=UPI00286E21FC|nr:hypothetical protein [Phenylobacterium sp.]